MNLQHLGYFVALAREQHFGRAAAACHVSQPTLSAGIRRLEGELGTLLVQRTQRFVGLTPEGERVLSWARRIVNDAEELRHDLGQLGEGLSGRLRIGAIPTSLAAVGVLTAPFRAANPRATVSVRSLSSREIERLLHTFELDVGLTYLDSEQLSGVRSLALYRERYLLLTTQPTVADVPVSWREAASLPLCLLSDDMQNRRIIDGIFQSVGVSPRPIVETDSVSTLFSHVRDGDLSTIVAQSWLHLFDLPPRLRVVPLVEPEASRAVGLVTLDRDPEPLLARAFAALADGIDVEALLEAASVRNR